MHGPQSPRAHSRDTSDFLIALSLAEVSTWRLDAFLGVQTQTLQLFFGWVPQGGCQDGWEGPFGCVCGGGASGVRHH